MSFGHEMQLLDAISKLFVVELELKFGDFGDIQYVFVHLLWMQGNKINIRVVSLTQLS